MRTTKSSSSRGAPLRSAAASGTGKLAGVAATVPAAEAGAMAGAAAASAPQVLQSAVLGPALAAMANLPEIDHAKVAELRDAIARGDLHFDAAKLAGLIQRFHGSRS
ncbi:MAG: flagellar biosynthesis anti-sigma factor FlgM [Aquincola tertiaricarbonis]|uniref:flagellar biosynthesis anti-sigma factor FlgM n=1 Tax=Aquincola tertiaricarbonis TaxID=391953 RepID=UPI0009F91670